MRTAAIAAALLVAASAGAGAATAQQPSLDVLLRRHVPILVLHPAEQLRPVAVDGFLADSDLQQRTATGWEKLDGPLPAGGADLRLDQRTCRAAEGVAATPCYAAAEAAHGSPPTVYGAAFRTRTRLVLQYWLWYPFNPYSPTVPPGEMWQVHEGDWESVSVLLDLRGRPLMVALSQHGAGQRRGWVRAPRRGPRPLAYVALGSHANYFSAGRQRFDPRVVEPLLIEIVRQSGFVPADHTGNGAVVRPRVTRVTATSPPWMTFAGRFGEDQYLHVPGGRVEPLGGGPRGPAFQDQWRRPVADVAGWPLG